MKRVPLILRAKRPWLRKFSYSVLAVGSAAIGWPIAYMYYNTIHFTLFILGLFLPVIMAGGEMLRIRNWAKKVPNVLCEDCQHIFSMKTLFKTAKCPKCQSRHLIGIKDIDDAKKGDD